MFIVHYVIMTKTVTFGFLNKVVMCVVGLDIVPFLPACLAYCRVDTVITFWHLFSIHLQSFSSLIS